jgi:hypothetical protein
MGVRIALVAASVAFATSSSAQPAKRPLPRNVTMIARGVWGGGASPDGKWFAHFTGTKARDVAIVPVAGGKSTTIEIGEPSCSTSVCLDNRCSAIAWSPDSSRLAYRSDRGLFEIAIAGPSKPARIAADAECTFRYAADGVLEYVAPGKQANALWRAGRDTPVVELPRDADSHELGDGVVVSGRFASSAGWADLWIVDRSARKIRRIFHRPDDDPASSSMWEPKLSPDQSRVCWQSAGVSCREIGSRRETITVSSVGSQNGRWGHERVLPFSPSGRLLAYRERTSGGGHALRVFDFDSGRSRVVVERLAHKAYAFVDESTIVLYEQVDYRDDTVPPVVRVAVDDGTQTVVVAGPDSEYNAPVIVPGNPRTIFIGRERPNSGARDLVRIDID